MKKIALAALVSLGMIGGSGMVFAATPPTHATKTEHSVTKTASTPAKPNQKTATTASKADHSTAKTTPKTEHSTQNTTKTPSKTEHSTAKKG